MLSMLFLNRANEQCGLILYKFGKISGECLLVDTLQCMDLKPESKVKLIRWSKGKSPFKSNTFALCTQLALISLNGVGFCIILTI